VSAVPAVKETDNKPRRLFRTRRKRPRSGGGTADKCDEFPSPHGFARAEDYIGCENNITFLNRELCRLLRLNGPLPCPLWVKSGHRRTFE